MNGSAELGESEHGRSAPPARAGRGLTLVAPPLSERPKPCGGRLRSAGFPAWGRAMPRYAALSAPPARRAAPCRAVRWSGGGEPAGRPVGARGVGVPGASLRPVMQMEGAGRGRRDSEPRKSGETPYKNYWGPFPGRTTKAPETAAARGGNERGTRRRGAASAPAGERKAAQATALQVGRLPVTCSTACLWRAYPPPPFFFVN